MKKFIIGVFTLASILSINIALTTPASAKPDTVSPGVCTAWGGTVVTDAIGKDYCDGGDFNGFNVE